MTQPEHRRILRNAARWLMALDPSDRPGPLIESDSTP